VERLSISPGTGLFEVLAQIGKHGLDLAHDLGKEVNIVISLGDSEVSLDRAQIVFDTLLHLVRNAIDHAFISKGTIYIAVCIKDEGLLVTVEDDGAGLDPEAVRSKAVEKGLIQPDGESLAPDEMIGLIFSPGFSTAESVSEISGRGVGLDAVKSLVEDSGGTISVRSEKGNGTVFEVFLPDTFPNSKRT
jgi:two-component system chemotaxis sensor kinase CheA